MFRMPWRKKADEVSKPSLQELIDQGIIHVTYADDPIFDNPEESAKRLEGMLMVDQIVEAKLQGDRKEADRLINEMLSRHLEKE